MWNKLLLTEFVIYLRCLNGLMPLVFSVLPYFFNPPSPLSKWSGELADWSNSPSWVGRLLVVPVVVLKVSRRCCWSVADCSILVILRDTVGLSSQTAQAATAPSYVRCLFFVFSRSNESRLAGQSRLSFHSCSFLALATTRGARNHKKIALTNCWKFHSAQISFYFKCYFFLENIFS